MHSPGSGSVRRARPSGRQDGGGLRKDEDGATMLQTVITPVAQADSGSGTASSDAASQQSASAAGAAGTNQAATVNSIVHNLMASSAPGAAAGHRGSFAGGRNSLSLNPNGPGVGVDPPPLHMQYAAAAEAQAAKNSLRGGSLGVVMIDGEVVPSGLRGSMAARRSVAARASQGGGISSGGLLGLTSSSSVMRSDGVMSGGWNSSGGVGKSSYASSQAYNPSNAMASSTVHHTAHPGAASLLPQTLHPSAAALTPLPSFSHEALGLYQLRIEADFAADLFQLKHNHALSAAARSAAALAALDRLAKECIVSQAKDKEDDVDQPRDHQRENAAAIMALLGSPRAGKAAAQAAAQTEEEAALEAASTHHQALKSTILNLRSMLLPLLVAPRGIFQESLHHAEETAVKHKAIVYESEANLGGAQAPDVVKLGPDGLPLAPKNERDKLREEKEAALAHVEQQLRAHEAGELMAHDHSLPHLNQSGGTAANPAQHDDEGAGAGGEEDAAAAEAHARRRKANYKFLLSRADEESGLQADWVPYAEVVQHLQYMKTALQARLLKEESAYLAGLEKLYAAGEESSALAEANRARDLKTATHARTEAKLTDEFAALRAKLAENYAELRHARQKNAEMKDMSKLHRAAVDARGGGGGGGGKDGVGHGGGRGGHHQQSNQKAKKDFEDLVMSLKETEDELTRLHKSISSANQEKDNLTTQVEILEQAVQTMRYMIKDILAKMNAPPTVTAGVTANGGPPALTASGQAATSGRGGSTPGSSPIATAAPGGTLAQSLRQVNPRHLRGEGSVTGAASLSAKNMIACAGIKNVPKFLAYSGWVTRYDLGKRNTELIIKEIWSLKTIADETRRKSGLKRTTLQEFFLRYLKSRFPHPGDETLHRKMEFTYNFVEACERYRADHDMDLFHKILFNQCSEERYIDQMTMMAHLKKCLTLFDIVDGVRDGFIHKLVFFQGLRQFFPTKSEVNSRALIEIVLREMQTKASKDPSDQEMAIDISKLMAETSDGDESAFMSQ